MLDLQALGNHSRALIPKVALFLLFFILLAFKAQATALFRVTLLNEDFYQKIYKVNHNTRQYFLIVSCKEKDMLSISVS